MKLEKVIQEDNLVEFKKMLANDKSILKRKFAHQKDSPILLYSVRCRSHKIFSYLLKHTSVSVNGRDKEGTTPLINACIKNDIRKVKMLLQNKKTKINARTIYGKTGLINAAQKGYTKLVNLLLQHDANVRLREVKRTKKSCANRNAFNMARVCGHKKIHKMLSNKRNSKKKVKFSK